MNSAFNSPKTKALILNISVAVGSALIMNGLIYGLGWNSSAGYEQRAFFAPPGYIIGIIWMILFALMASARWMLNSLESGEAKRARLYVTILLVSCLIWPLYSLAIGSVAGGFWGTIWALALAAFTLKLLWRVSRKAAYCILPVLLWVIFATAIIVTEAGWI